MWLYRQRCLVATCNETLDIEGFQLNTRRSSPLLTGRVFAAGVAGATGHNPAQPFALSLDFRKSSPSESNWDGVVGVRGNYCLTDKWFLPYSVNAGTCQFDFTWDGLAALGYRFKKLDAVAGWRYLYYDLGSDTALKALNANGPFAGVVSHW